jgi:serine kinase of HPr protein (carbohydrate metabolism regulator)
LKVEFVSDDQTELVLRDTQIYASPPASIGGLLEIRGQEILRLAFATGVPVAMVVDLKPAQTIERLAQLSVVILGVKLPLFEIDAVHPSAAARVRVAFGRLEKLQTL